MNGTDGSSIGSVRETACIRERCREKGPKMMKGYRMLLGNAA
jgi:hypothetical protein